MSSAFLRIGSWSLNTKHVTYVRKIAGGESWEVAGFRGLMNIPTLLVDDAAVQEFRKALPPGFVAVKSIGSLDPILINLENIAGVERQAPRSAPGGHFGPLPASSAHYEQNLGASPGMVSAERLGDGVVYKLYTLVAGARANVLTIESKEDPFK